MNEKRIPLRSELDPACCWSVTDLFPSDDAWNDEFNACQAIPAQIAAFKGRLGESAQTLFDYLSTKEALSDRLDKLGSYSFLRQCEDTAQPAYQAMQGRTLSFFTELAGASAFEGPELVAIPDDTLDQFYRDLPALEKYRRFLTKARLRKPHTLSPSEEALLAGAGELGRAPGNIFNTFHDADMKFPAVHDSAGNAFPLSQGSYLSLLESPDRTLRKNAFSAYYKVYNDSRNMLAATLDAQIRKDIFFARARKYDSALQASLAPVEVPEAVYHNLLAAVRKNLDKMDRYMQLRKKALRVDELHMYDVYTSIVPDADQPVPFDTARQNVLDATAVLGEEYSSVLASSFSQRWMDIYENQGKRSGAFSSGTPVHPFVLLNYKDTLDSQFTLAHEMGHAMHSFLSSKYQPSIYSNYVLFVAEVASTCNEALLMQHLLKKTSDKKQRAALINYFLEQFRTTLFRQTMFAEFELKVHQLAEQGQALTAERFSQIYHQLNHDYYGPSVVNDPDIAMEWARIPHFYRFFYVYQYATGFSAAIALSKRILSGGNEAVQDYLKFLSGGCSTDPISLLKIAGVDMSSPQPVDDALLLFGELIDELDGLLRD